MGQFALAVRWMLLCSSAALRAALRDGPVAENLNLDEPSNECEEEAKFVQQMMLDLGFQGPMTTDHCDMPGIQCFRRSCRVAAISCMTCTGHLPDYIPLKHLEEVYLPSPEITGDIKAFAGTPGLNRR